MLGARLSAEVIMRTVETILFRTRVEIALPIDLRGTYVVSQVAGTASSLQVTVLLTV